ncbi:hypothetical protein VNO77_20061 [Canavalia gladiata]|uniref:Uncharacterized protein n=1 Tax=Canavalia gladiata TaxID=3824 RepID=A0AAN9LSS8_CANGL
MGMKGDAAWLRSALSAVKERERWDQGNSREGLEGSDATHDLHQASREDPILTSVCGATSVASVLRAWCRATGSMARTAVAKDPKTMEALV